MSRQDRQCGPEYQAAGDGCDVAGHICFCHLREDIGKEGRGFKVGKEAEPAAPQRRSTRVGAEQAKPSAKTR